MRVFDGDNLIQAFHKYKGGIGLEPHSKEVAFSFEDDDGRQIAILMDIKEIGKILEGLAGNIDGIFDRLNGLEDGYIIHDD